MTIASTADVVRVVLDCCEKAVDVANEAILFSEGRKAAKALMLASLPKFALLPHTYGFAGWATILSVDLRGSSERAVRIGAKDTFVTMQTYVPTMAFLVGEANGLIVGLRGDGLFAAFGFKENPVQPTRGEKEDAVRQAACCGRAMIEAVNHYINPVLIRNHIEGGLRIGVGIDVGQIVVTRIGWEDAQEVTTYGEAVNRACKIRADDCVVLTNEAWGVYPSSEGGRLTSTPVSGGRQLIVPGDLPPMIS